MHFPCFLLEWQELSMDISTITSNTYDKIVLFPEAWQSKPAFTFYIDDIILVKKDIAAVNDVNSGVKSSIFYSSAQNNLSVKCNGTGLVELITVTGVVIKSVNIHEDSVIELSGITNGVYFVRLKNSEGQDIQKILVRNKL